MRLAAPKFKHTIHKNINAVQRNMTRPTTLPNITNKRKKNIDWDSATRTTYSTNYKQRRSLESWYINRIVTRCVMGGRGGGGCEYSYRPIWFCQMEFLCKVNCLQKKSVGQNRIYEYFPPPTRLVTALHINLEQNPLKRSQQLPAPYKRLIHNSKQTNKQ